MNANPKLSRDDSPLWGAAHRPAPHYLWLGLAASLFVHAMLMAWQGQQRAPLPARTSVLEVALVNARSTDAPVTAQVLAQANVDGGGDAQSGVASSPLPRTGEAPNTIVLEALRRRQAELEAEQLKLLTQLKSRAQAAPEKSTAHPWPDGQAPGNAETDQESVVLNAQIAVLSERIQAYNQAPRKQFVAPSAASAVHAAYVDAWRTRIEAVGTKHYPQQARGRTYGSLQMTVYIRADGSVVDAVIDRPAEHQVLNLAARRIVQLAAPYPPFPPELAAMTDVLAITRTWNFVNDTLDTQAP